MQVPTALASSSLRFVLAIVLSVPIHVVVACCRSSCFVDLNMTAPGDGTQSILSATICGRGPLILHHHLSPLASLPSSPPPPSATKQDRPSRHTRSSHFHAAKHTTKTSIERVCRHELNADNDVSRLLHAECSCQQDLVS